MKVFSASIVVCTIVCAASVSARRLGEQSVASELPEEQQQKHRKAFPGGNAAAHDALSSPTGSQNAPSPTQNERKMDYAAIPTTTTTGQPPASDGPMTLEALAGMVMSMGSSTGFNPQEIYGRCCGADVEGCLCPVRTNATYVPKWKSVCEDTLKPALSGPPPAPAGGPPAAAAGGPPAMDIPTILASLGLSSVDEFDLPAMYLDMFNKTFDYVKINNKCCGSGDVEKPNAYDLSGGMSCQCPQRIIMASIWDQQCTDVIGPGAAAAARK